MVKFIFSAEQEAAIATRYRAGESAIAISKTLDVNNQTINNVLHRLSVVIRSKTLFTPEQDKLVADRYLAGESTLDIAKSLGVTGTTVGGALRRCDVKTRPKKILTTQQEGAILLRYGAGATALALGAMFGVDDQTIHNTLARYGVAHRPEMVKTPLPAEKRKAIIKACIENKSVPAVAHVFATSPQTVSRILRTFREEGGIVEMPKGTPPTCELDHAVFDALTPESLYWSGFLFSDGWVHQDDYGSPALGCCLGEKDLAHLEKLRDFTKSTHAISRRVCKATTMTVGGKTYNVRERVCFDWRVRSTPIYTALRARGMVKKRTRLPVKELASSRDFFRGNIDGDGWLGTKADDAGVISPYIGLSGQIPILESFKAFLYANHLTVPNIIPTDSGIWKVQIAGAGADDIIRLLYADPAAVLDRKNVRAQAIIAGDLHKFPPYVEAPGLIPVFDTSFPYPEMLSAEETTHEVRRLREASFRLVGGVIRPMNRFGVALCMSFFPNRYRAHAGRYLSAFDAWNDEGERQKAIDFQVTHGDPVTPERVLRAVTLRCRTPSIFRPAVARFIYERYCRPGGTVWDPCAGYGGRLLGAHAAGVHYIGTDVDPETIEGNRTLAKAIGSDAVLHLCPAEDFTPPKVNLVFTSPPYFDRERYSQEEGQSWKKYESVEAWMEGFLRPIIARAHKALRSNTCLVLNIADLAEMPLVERTIVVAIAAGFLHAETLKMPLSAINRTAPMEPVLVFRKP